MRIVVILMLGVLLAAPGAARAAIRCSDLPKAERFVHERLKPGPNTRLAERHLAAAQNAHSSRGCAAELRRVDYYAKRSIAADRRTARR